MLPRRIRKPNFNTTLVTVYLEGELFRVVEIRISIQLLLLFIEKLSDIISQLGGFQYNSCYCLSLFRPLKRSLPISFQYNSCYCLSVDEDTAALTIYNFNTTLVTVYRLDEAWSQWMDAHFNTTLVTVYHGPYHWFKTNWIFQYNSCYCLSKKTE